MGRSPPLKLCGLFALVVLAPCAAAHPGHGHGIGFAAGLAHPFSGIDHVLAMVAVGLLAVQIGQRAIWLLPSAFIALMVAGGLLNLAGVHVPLVDQAIIASVLILGLLIAGSAKLPLVMSASLVGAFAIFHGYAHAGEMAAGQSPTTYAAGFVIASAVLHGVGISAGLSAQRLASPSLLRFCGSAIALCGLLLLLGVIQG